MSQIHVTAYFKIHDGQHDEFKRLAALCLDSVKEKDTGTLQYDWFLSDDGSECAVRERYVNSDAVLEHMGNLGEVLPALLGVADLSLEVYGTPSGELAEALSGLEVKTYGYYQGL